jgi:hypothetical protein
MFVLFLSVLTAAFCIGPSLSAVFIFRFVGVGTFISRFQILFAIACSDACSKRQRENLHLQVFPNI